MKTTKINLDRPKVSSEEIEKRQDLEKIISGAKAFKPGVFRNAWFYGVVGVCSFALIGFLLVNNDEGSRNIATEKPLEASAASFYEPEEKTITTVVTENEIESKKKEVVVNTNSEKEILALVPAPDNQLQPLTEKKNKKAGAGAKKLMTVPNIGGVHSGTIKSSELLKIERVESGSSEPVKSFMVGYFNGTTDVMEFVSGNQLSEKLRHDLVEYNTGEMVFFTEMYSTDSEGKLHMLPSINFRILPN